MPRSKVTFFILLGALASLGGCVSAKYASKSPQDDFLTRPQVVSESDVLTAELATVAPALNHQVLHRAVAAMQCALNDGAAEAERLAVIDFSLPSSQRRLWIFDLQSRQLVLKDFVAHGKGSGENHATSFSNVEGSHQSSLGLFRTAESYFGAHGYSLRMDGLEQGINDLARQRAIVIHGADYVDPTWIPRQGRIGRSLGCPAVRPEVADTVVDNLKDGQFLFSYYPDSRWLSNSSYLNCSSPEPTLRLTSADGTDSLLTTER